MAATKITTCAVGGTQQDIDITGTPLATAIEQEWADHAPGTGAVWTAEQQAALASLRTQAKAVLADVNADQQVLARATRALALTVLTEVNLLRQWLVSLKIAVAGAGTLAQLKTAVAALPNTPDRTAAQLRQAIRDAIDGE